MFITVLSTQRSLIKTIDLMGDGFRYDVLTLLTQPYRTEQLRTMIQGIPRVGAVEIWNQRNLPLKRYPTNIDISVYRVPPDSQLLLPQLSNGRPLKTQMGMQSC